MKKTEQTLLWVSRIIDSEKITSDNFNSDSYKLILEFLLSKKYKKIYNSDVKISHKPTYGGLCYINERYKNKIIKNVISIEFDNFYGQILNEKLDSYYFNYENFPEVWRDMYNLYLVSNNGDELSLIVKKWVNYTYGLLGSGLVISSDYNILDDVISESRRILNNLLNNFKDEIIYIDTDRVKFKFNKKLMDTVDNIHYNKTISYIDNFLLIGKKRYMEYSDNNIITKVVGISKIV